MLFHLWLFQYKLGLTNVTTINYYYPTSPVEHWRAFTKGTARSSMPPVVLKFLLVSYWVTVSHRSPLYPVHKLPRRLNSDFCYACLPIWGSITFDKRRSNSWLMHTDPINLCIVQVCIHCTVFGNNNNNNINSPLLCLLSKVWYVKVCWAWAAGTPGSKIILALDQLASIAFVYKSQFDLTAIWAKMHVLLKPFSLVMRSHCCISKAEYRRKFHPSLCVAPMAHA